MTTVSTERVTLRLLREAANAEPPMASGIWSVRFSPDLAPSVADLPNFTPVLKYVSGSPRAGEFGKVERFRLLEDAALPSQTVTLEQEPSASG